MTRRPGLLLLLALALPPALRGVTPQLFTPGELAARAELVVTASVVELRAERDAAGRPRGVTRLAVAEVWKGTPAGSSLEVVQADAVLGAEQVETAGAVKLAVGDRVVAFLHRSPAGEWIWVARAQGCFVVLEEESREALASNGYWGSPGGTAAAAQPPHRRPLSVARLRRLVQEEAP
ncbi:MAG TPA: hypothetical protein PKE47_15035 [Verrucomicrobiota bacterium]|nr:hypothetical protein [Verrucomicrobiota bacterium]